MPRDFQQRPTVNGAPVALQSEVSSGGGPTVVKITADVVNNNATANTLADVTGLAFNVVAGQLYRFRFMVRYDSAATTTGSRWTLGGPVFDILAYRVTCANSATSSSDSNQNAYNSGAPNAGSLVAGNLMVMEGIVRPTANGTVQLRFASEVASSAITVRQQSFVEVSER